MWIASIISTIAEILAASADDPGTVIPVLGGGTLSAVLFYLLREEKAERRELQKTHEALLERMLPTFSAVTDVMERVSQALSKQVDYHERGTSTSALDEAVEHLEQLLKQYSPQTNRYRQRGS